MHEPVVSIDRPRPVLGAPVATATRLAVVVPARNEEAHISDCLAAVDLAGRIAGRSLDIVVVLDSCIDETMAAVTSASPDLRSRLHVLHTSARRVGISRHVGVLTALSVLGVGNHWVATTDADSVVPPDWFVRQLSYRAAGAEMVVGTVCVDDWTDRGRLRSHYEQTYASHVDQRAVGHRHVHGANLSFSARAYLRSGGFPNLASGEDVHLVDAFRAAGESIAWASDLAVATSVRRIGRAPCGFAAHLNELAHALDPLGGPEPTLELIG